MMHQWPIKSIVAIYSLARMIIAATFIMVHEDDEILLTGYFQSCHSQIF